MKKMAHMFTATLSSLMNVLQGSHILIPTYVTCCELCRGAVLLGYWAFVIG
jgi:hypothetical protein